MKSSNGEVWGFCQILGHLSSHSCPFVSAACGIHLWTRLFQKKSYDCKTFHLDVPSWRYREALAEFCALSATRSDAFPASVLFSRCPATKALWDAGRATSAELQFSWVQSWWGGALGVMWGSCVWTVNPSQYDFWYVCIIFHLIQC